MGQSSARPQNLKDFQTRTEQLDTSISGEHTLLSSALTRFTTDNGWGSLEATGLVANVAEFVKLNRSDAKWVAAIGDAFRAADASGSVAYATDAEIASSLKAAGITSRGRADITVDPSVATGGLQTTGYANDPVSAASGNFIEIEIDLGFGPTLTDLQVRRTFNSRDTATGPFGRGWSSWASTRLAVDATGHWADWRGPDGQVARILLAEGTCTGFEGRVVAATADGGGSSNGASAGAGDPSDPGLIADFPKEGMVWRFDRSGRPVETSRGPGTGLRLTWDGQRLTALTHERGRQVTFAWDGERITSALADDGRRVSYTYDDAGHLIAVDGPMGARRYEVDPAGLILSVSDADGVVAAANTYDEQGRVLTQRTEFGRLVRFNYLDGLVTVVDDDAAGPVNRYEHDRYGRLLEVVDGHGRAVTRDYDGRGRVVAVKDRNDAVTRYEWDEQDRQTAVIEPDGIRVETVHDDHHRPVTVTRGPAVTRFTYTGEERTPTEIVDPTGAVTRYEVVHGLIRRAIDPDGVTVDLAYDEQGRLVATTDALGGIRRYEWDATGQIAALVSPSGARTHFVRDAAGRILEQTLPTGATWRYERSAAGRVLAVVDPMGDRRVFERGDHGDVTAEVDELGAVTGVRYDTFGNVIARSLPDGGKWEYQYDSLMRVVGTTDPGGATWLREYDAEGNLIGSFTPEGVHRSLLVDATGRTIELHDGLTSARFEYDELGRPVAQIRRDGTRASGTYDLVGRLVSVTEPTGGTSQFHLSPAGRLIGVTGPEGGTTGYRYDEAGRLVEITGAVGATQRLRLDADGRVVRFVEPTGEVTRYGYDADGRITAVSAPDGGTRRYRYDRAGRLVTLIDPTGATITYEYDAAGRVTAVTDPNGGVTRLERDAEGRVTAETDPLGATTRLRLDEMGRVLESTDPLGRRTRMAYDPSGRLLRRLDPDGRRWRWSYDESDRVRSWGVDGEIDVTVTRDLLGRIVRLADNEGSVVEWTWNRDGDLVAETTTTPLGRVSITSTYDRAGRRVGWTVNGRSTSVALDAAGRTRRLLDPDTGPLTIDRDGMGRITSLAVADRRERRAYLDGHLASWTFESPHRRASTSFARDPAGRVTATSGQVDGERFETRAEYDPAGQLVRLADRRGDATYAYDAGGRLIREAARDGVTTHSYDAAGQRLRTDGPTGTIDLTWDAAGRRIGETGDARRRRYHYDVAGRTARIDTAEAGATSTRRFTYDPLDRLSAVDDTVLGWDSVDPYGALRTVGDQHLVGATAALASAGPDGDVSWFDADHRGTPGAPDVWGSGAGPAPSMPAGLGIGLGGELAIDDQVWMRARLYDPGSRSFTAPDPLPGVLGQPAVANPYHFGVNDPLNQLDPSGMRPLTEADLDKIRADWNKNAWDRYGNYVIAGALIVGGIAVMATGVGGPIGAAMIGGALLAGGVSAGTQQYSNGSVDWGKVGVDMVIGAAAGGAGAWAGTALKAAPLLAKAGPIGRGAVLGSAENVVGGMASRGLAGENPLDPQGLGLDLVTGGVIGGAGGKIGARSRGAQQVDNASGGSTTFHTAQSPADATRLRAGGEPWPTEPNRAALGEGVYAWGSEAEAQAYADIFRARGHDIEVVPFSVSNLDLAGMRRVDVDSLPDPSAFMGKYSQLWDGTPDHGYDYVTRGTARGVEHFFHKTVFPLLDFGSG